jgi:penicillin amidase
MTSRPSSRLWRYLIAALLLIVGAVVLDGWWMVHRSLPALDGSASLPELKQEVIVDRDQWGIPWIQAGSVDDLATAQGYIVAQDRLWQMDLLRRAAAGDLSEIFGSVALDLDRENRTLGLRLAAEEATSRMDPETRSIVEAYARGVNRYIEEHRGKLPIEFTLLRYQPRPWTPADTFLISVYMWKTLTTTWKAKLNRAVITARVGADRARDLFVIDSPLDHFIAGSAPPPPAVSAQSQIVTGPSNAPRTLELSRQWTAARAFLEQFDEGVSEVLGSNNFVVSGEHTYSAKPLLANDTHLGLSVPSIWYIVHLSAPGWNVKGFTFPGSPLVIIGHNERIAWGFTNSNADVQDLYIEEFNPSDPLEYRANGAWASATVRHEIIHVKRQADDALDVVVTRHGAVVHREGGIGYALRWTATDPGGLDFGYPQLGRARNWNEFLDVMRHVNGPGQNGIYADVDGNIGFIIAARIPVRRNGHGEVPVPGDTDDYEWAGYIPFDELPRAFNPSEGVIATANARTVGPAYPYFLTERWAGPWRTERLYELLSGKKDLRPADCNTIQNDIVSLPDHLIAEQLLHASQARTPNDPRARTLLAKLSGWDYRAAADSAETTFLEYTRHMLFRNLLQPYLDDKTYDYELWEPRSVYNDVWWRDKVFLADVLRDRPAAWLPKPYGTYDELLMASADQAVAQIEKETGRSNATEWDWGKIHQLEMFHPLGRSAVLKKFLSIGPFENEGTVDTVKAMGHGHGPAMRFVADLANFDDSLMEIPTGESGQYGSPHYRDQFVEWFAGRGIPAPFSAAAEERVRAHRFHLLPANSAAPSGR